LLAGIWSPATGGEAEPSKSEQRPPDIPGVGPRISMSLRSLIEMRASTSPLMSRLHFLIAEEASLLSPADRGALFARLAEALPWLLGEPDFARVAELCGVDLDAIRGRGSANSSVEQVAFEGLRWLAANFLPHRRPLETEEEVVQFVTKIRETLRVFLRSFVPLRDGHRAFTSELDVRPASRVTFTHEAGAARAVENGVDAEDLATALLDYENPSNLAHRLVEGTFADLMIHQLALLQGVMRGVTSLLGELAPARIEADLQELRSKGNAGLAFGPFRFRRLWELFRKRYGNLDDGERVAFAYVFGPEFERAYTQLIDDAESQANVDSDTR
jgi:type VI secretion system protein ImpI